MKVPNPNDAEFVYFGQESDVSDYQLARTCLVSYLLINRLIEFQGLPFFQKRLSILTSFRNTRKASLKEISTFSRASDFQLSLTNIASVI